MKKTILLLTICFAAIASQAAGGSIDTTPMWNGTSSIGPFIGGAGRAFGQTFIVGEQNLLTSFSFFVGGKGSFTSYVMEWAGDRTAGPVLFQGPAETVGSALTQHLISTGGLTLVSSHTYIAFLDAGDAPQPLDGYFNVGILSGNDPYPDGQFFLSSRSHTGTTFDQLSTDPWSGEEAQGDDAAFTATFFPDVPPPVPPPGDYNRNRIVDAADYTIWRDTVGNVVTPCSGADANCNGFVENGEYQVWKDHFGETNLSGASAAVPEPSSLLLCMIAATWTVLFRPRRHPASRD